MSVSASLFSSGSRSASLRVRRVTGGLRASVRHRPVRRKPCRPTERGGNAPLRSCRCSHIRRGFIRGSSRNPPQPDPFGHRCDTSPPWPGQSNLSTPVHLFPLQSSGASSGAPSETQLGSPRPAPEVNTPALEPEPAQADSTEAAPAEGASPDSEASGTKREMMKVEDKAGEQKTSGCLGQEKADG